MFTRSKGVVDKKGLKWLSWERRGENIEGQGDSVELTDLEKSVESPPVVSDDTALTLLEHQNFREPAALIPGSSSSSSSSKENIISDILRTSFNCTP